MKNPRDPETPVLDIDEDGRARALRVAIEDAAGDFSTILVEAPVGAHQDAVMARLAAWSGRGDVPTLAFVDVATERQSVVEPLYDAMDRGAGGVVLFGLEPHFPAGRREREAGSASMAVHQLNGLRDELGDFIRGPLVIVANAHALTRMAVMLPDFWSWRTFSTEARRVG